jgi:hypothetical protein
MEWCLNSFWFSLSWIFLGPFLWSLWKSHPKALLSYRFRYLIAGGCFLALLFPVISVSDDLASARRLSERTHGPRQGAKKVMENDDVSEVRKVPPPVASLQLRAPLLNYQPLFAMLTREPAPQSIDVASPQHGTRAPPEQSPSRIFSSSLISLVQCFHREH